MGVVKQPMRSLQKRTGIHGDKNKVFQLEIEIVASRVKCSLIVFTIDSRWQNIGTELCRDQIISGAISNQYLYKLSFINRERIIENKY
jgi:hypothetical protein